MTANDEAAAINEIATLAETPQDHLSYTTAEVDTLLTKVDGSEQFTLEDKTKLNDLNTRMTALEDKVSNYHETIVYGYHIDPNEADSSAKVTYLADAVGMTPAAMGTDSFNYGSWQNAFFMPKPCMLKYDGTVAYYLNPNDYSKKIDGTPSDVANPDFEGNAMMEWRLIWYKFVGGNTDGEGSFYVANKQIDDSYHCWCNYDSNNNIIPHFYTAIYNSTLHNGKFRSLSGLALTKENGSGYTPGAQEITYCTANNMTDTVEWYTDVYADKILINALHVLISKSLNTQASFGRGLDTGGETNKNAYVTGTFDNKGLFYGVTANGTSGVKTFGMENWWGCIWHRVAGCIMAAHDYKVKLTYGTADGTTANGYNSTGEGYISTGTAPSTNGYIKKFKYDEHGYMPFEVGGSSSTYYADYYNQNTGTYYLLTGGRTGTGTNAGTFYFILNNTFTNSNWNVSTVTSYKNIIIMYHIFLTPW